VPASDQNSVAGRINDSDSVKSWQTLSPIGERENGKSQADKEKEETEIDSTVLSCLDKTVLPFRSSDGFPRVCFQLAHLCCSSTDGEN
jgi:hypothetical protein